MFNLDGCKNKAIDSNWSVCCESSYGLMPFFNAFPDRIYRIHSIGAGKDVGKGCSVHI